MSLTHEDLAARIRQAREAAGFTQDDVAGALGISRPAVVMLEAGKRKVSSVELATLARLFGRSMHDFFDESFEPDGVAFVWRALPEARHDPETQAGMSRGLEVVNAILGLEGLLGLERVAPHLPRYELPPPSTNWDAVVQGADLARQERERLRLGVDPVADPGAVLEGEGVLVLSLALPRGVSGLTFQARRAMVCVISSTDAPVRQRYSLAHEYCHALCDLVGAPGIVSREGDRKDPREVRADAFAAAFLMPEEGVRSYLTRLGKARRSRLSAETGAGTVREPQAEYEVRRPRKAREVDIWDVARLAQLFGVSRLAAIWRLANLRLIPARRRERLLDEEAKGYARELGALVGDEERALPARPRLQPAEQRLVSLALDAIAADEISRGKLVELLRLAGLDDDQIWSVSQARRGGE